MCRCVFGFFTANDMLMPDEAIKSDEPFQMPVGFESDARLGLSRQN